MKKGIVGVLVAIGAAAAGLSVMGKHFGDRVKAIRKMSDKHLTLFLMMNQWVKVKQTGKSLVAFFEEEGYKEIAIYGMSYAGETLVEELAGSNVKIKYGIDKNADRIFADFDVVEPESSLDEVDAIVVTSITFFDEIEVMLREKVNCPIISLEDILYTL
ncbi:MAG: hypothetical protein K2N34_01010 [Lachnospiraceae bacterium]|nr:hypothetical protein [Lachnospiraceae bacterium]